jgi:hypothetical protein
VFCDVAAGRALEGTTKVIRGTLIIVGALLAIVGTVFALQGFGVLGGSAMSGSHIWATAGPLIAVAGLVIMAAGARRTSARRRS